MDSKIDACFNLTSTYRRDSDVVRRFGNIEKSIVRARFDRKTGNLLVDDHTYFLELMSNKFHPGSSYNTAWFVSNCNQTAGAIRRYNFVKSLVLAGLKLYSEGSRS